MKQAFGDLLFFNEESLAPQQSQTYISAIAMTSIIVPLTGAIDCTHSDTLNIGADQIQFLKLHPGEFYTVKNIFYNNPVSYLHIGIKETIQSSFTDTIFLERKNALLLLCDYVRTIQTKFYIGTFDCRIKGTYQTTQKNTGLFAYITCGSFKIDNRLLEQGDALSIQDIHEIRFEALAPNSILILVETSLERF